VRTGDLNLGKVPRYQLRYIRVSENEIYPKPLPSTNPPSSFEPMVPNLLDFGSTKVRERRSIG
ncbi:MAG: hypothetical protein WCO85_02340, partial [Actinomycetes bacterium]